jgi:predicted metalloprotease with PDZ domain
MRKTPVARYDAGISLERENQQSLTVENIRPESPAENAGLEPGDTIVSIGGTTVTRETWTRALSRYREGERVTLVIRRARGPLQISLKIGPPEHGEFVIEEMKNASPEARALRAAWLQG